MVSLLVCWLELRRTLRWVWAQRVQRVQAAALQQSRQLAIKLHLVHSSAPVDDDTDEAGRPALGQHSTPAIDCAASPAQNRYADAWLVVNRSCSHWNHHPRNRHCASWRSRSSSACACNATGPTHGSPWQMDCYRSSAW